jgi:cyclopropane-fatty-acyl-phospholipid synthase
MKRSRSRPLGVPDAGPIESDVHGEGPGFARVLARKLFGALIDRAGRPPIEFALAGGHVLYAPQGRALGRVVFRDLGAVWAVVRQPELGFGDAFAAGRVQIDGDLVDTLFHLFRASDAAGQRASKRSLLGTQPSARRNSLRNSRDHIRHHYDLGNDFYARWLDERMVYTCAYYAHPSMSLEQAQVAKLEHVSRKLELAPGMEVVEAGCGWGALAMHMVRVHGVKVRAFNISSEQIAYARERAAREGLGDRVQFIQDDYRNVTGRYDAFVSVGMLEHVGVDNYPALGSVIARCLHRHGRALLHSVGRTRPQAPNAWLERRIFPGSYPPSLREIMDILEPWRFTVIDVENLRLHYAKTLLEWLHRFEGGAQEVRRDHGEEFVRAWRLYLGGCAAAFRANTIQLYQIVFTHPDNNDVAMTREHQYTGAASTRWTGL